MRLKEIYKADIDRDINGVIKTAQNDEASVKQELEEYVVTRELRGHFSTFFSNYERTLSRSTDKTGVWISGFFGSGKSHFLKILSYLLSGCVIAGKRAVDYFADKFDDARLFEQIARCASVPTETILFNIDSKSPINKDKTAILRVFARVFYEHLGFCGNDLKVARLEQFISRAGKTEAFRQAFAAINGRDWLNEREAFAFFEDDIIRCMIEVLGMSETAARNWFNGTETADMSIQQLVSEINAYVDGRGADFRLVFLIDEVGQYIGSDGDLMLNLQTIAEEIGAQCGGRVWVIVTSQEALDSVTNIGGDFSKIQSRFHIRLSLSSASVDEVIKKRLLAKTTEAEKLLKSSFGKHLAALRNLFSFHDAALDLKGYADADDFMQCYPFVPYQFRLMQDIFAKLRRHGSAGRHLSGGERSLLSGFQEAAQALEDRDETALAPFYLFYDTLKPYLEDAGRRVISRCQDAADDRAGLEQYDVSVLKLLCLLRYADGVRADLDTIATLMIDRIDADKLAIRKAVQASLYRLLARNDIDRIGDVYVFLTHDEQAIASEIRNTPVDSADITQAIAQIVFAELFALKKLRYGKYEFSFEKLLDDTVWGSPAGEIKLRIVTGSSELFDGGDQRMMMQSGANHEAIVVLADALPYFEELENAMKISRYVKSRNVAQLPERIRSIVRSRQQQASTSGQRAREYLAQAIVNGRFYVGGDRISPKGTAVKEKLTAVLSVLVECVYTKLGLVRSSVESDEEIRQILANEIDAARLFAQPNADALAELEQFLQMQELRRLPTSIAELRQRFHRAPYGWREIDIAALIAVLAAEQKITVSYDGGSILPSDDKLADCLRQANEAAKTFVSRRAAVPDAILKSVRAFLGEYFNVMDVPADEEGLVQFVTDRFAAQQDEFAALLKEHYADGCDPGRDVVDQGIRLCEEVLACKKDSAALFRRINSLRDELLDHSDDMTAVSAFFKDQKEVFDSAKTFCETLANEVDYLEADAEAVRALQMAAEIFALPKPYRRINELPALVQLLRAKYAALLAVKKEEVITELQAAADELCRFAGAGQKESLDKAEHAVEAGKQAAAGMATLTGLDALRSRTEISRRRYLTALIAAKAQGADAVTALRTDVCHIARLADEADVEAYLSAVKERLLAAMEEHDALYII